MQGLRQTEKAAIKCDQMGLEILNVHSNGGKVSIEVANNEIARQMVEKRLAFSYKRASDDQGIYSEAKIVLDGVKVFWKDYQHPIITTRTH